MLIPIAFLSGALVGIVGRAVYEVWREVGEWRVVKVDSFRCQNCSGNRFAFRPILFQCVNCCAETSCEASSVEGLLPSPTNNRGEAHRR